MSKKRKKCDLPECISPYVNVDTLSESDSESDREESGNNTVVDSNEIAELYRKNSRFLKTQLLIRTGRMIVFNLDIRNQQKPINYIIAFLKFLYSKGHIPDIFDYRVSVRLSFLLARREAVLERVFPMIFTAG